MYLDVNVYNAVERDEIPVDEVEVFRAARQRGDISVLVGIPVIEEALGVWPTNPTMARRRLQILEAVAGFDHVLKQVADLFDDAIRAYAAGRPQPSPLLRWAHRKQLARIFRTIASGGGARYSGTIDALLAEVKHNKEAFKADMTASRAESLAQLAGRDLSTTRFADYFHRGAADWASDFAEPSGAAAQCRERGLEGLLAIPTMRLAVGVSMSIVYSQVCEGHAPSFGDGYNRVHAGESRG